MTGAVAVEAGTPEPSAAVPLCIDCRWCTDGDVQRSPGNLICLHPDPYGRRGVYYAYDRRRSWRYCDKDGKWFEDALSEDAQGKPLSSG